MSDHDLWITAFSVESIEDGEAALFEHADVERIAVYRVGDTFFATQDRCTHAEASLCEGWLEGYSIGCPVHMAEFDIRTGEVLRPPANEPLRTYGTRIRDGFVQVNVGIAAGGADRTRSTPLQSGEQMESRK